MNWIALVSGGVGLILAAGGVAVYFARRFERAKVTQEHADAVAIVKDKASKELRRPRTRRTTAESLRDGKF